MLPVKKKQKRRKPTTEQLLQACPYRNQNIEVLVRDDDHLLLSAPIRRRWWNSLLLRWLVPMSKFHRFELDRRGMFFFDLCDGKRTVADIVASFSEAYDLGPLEARIAVAAFLDVLIQKQVVALVGTPSENGKA